MSFFGSSKSERIKVCSNGQKGRMIHAEWGGHRNDYLWLGDGKKVDILPIQHPSIGFSWNNWHPVIDEFLTGL